eukprot:m.82601 g.82601  ORF g.82601 m.82601 type:complete len:423 (-) comp8670_c0_seq2:94-1362(-)
MFSRANTHTIVIIMRTSDSFLLLSLAFILMFSLHVSGECPLHTLPVGELHFSDVQCMCTEDQYCLGELCRFGSIKEENGKTMRRVQAFPSKCKECDCVRITQKQKTVPFREWSSKNLYFHLHISKTGGTTFLHFLDRLVRKGAVSDGMKMCHVDKHPFKNPPYFADPASLIPLNCNVVSAESRMRVFHSQFPRVKPELLLFLRHPVLRTVSQFKHDYIYESHHMREDYKGSLFTYGHDHLVDLYTDPDAKIHPRYGDWQLDLITGETDFLNYPNDIERFTFIGLTEYYRTSICLFYFTFKITKLLGSCQYTPLDAFNIACTQTNSSDCKFHNEAGGIEHHEKSLAEELEHNLASIDGKTKEMINKHTRKDQELYNYAQDIFWNRVAVMEEVTQQRFNDLPDKYRQRLSRVPFSIEFETRKNG